MGLAGPRFLGNPDFNVPFSFVFGDVDWVKSIDQEASARLIKERRDMVDSESIKQQYNYHLLPDSDHNMFYDNPMGLSNLLINELLQPAEPLPVLKAREY